VAVVPVVSVETRIKCVYACMYVWMYVCCTVLLVPA